MCLGIPIQYQCCRRIYAEVSKLNYCSDNWPHEKCIGERCMKSGSNWSGGYIKQVAGTCWRCQVEGLELSEEERNTHRSVLDKAKLIDPSKLNPPAKRSKKIKVKAPKDGIKKRGRPKGTSNRKKLEAIQAETQIVSVSDCTNNTNAVSSNSQDPWHTQPLQPSLSGYSAWHTSERGSYGYDDYANDPHLDQANTTSPFTLNQAFSPSYVNPQHIEQSTMEHEDTNVCQFERMYSDGGQLPEGVDPEIWDPITGEPANGYQVLGYPYTDEHNIAPELQAQMQISEVEPAQITTAPVPPVDDFRPRFTGTPPPYDYDQPQILRKAPVVPDPAEVNAVSPSPRIDPIPRFTGTPPPDGACYRPVPRKVHVVPELVNAIVPPSPPTSTHPPE